MSFFKVTKEDINKAKESTRFEFKDGDKPILMITEIKEITETGKEKLIVSGQVLGGEYNGRKYSIYISPKQTSMMIEFLSCFYSEEQILNGEANPEHIIGQKITFEVNLREYNGKQYPNYRRMKLATDIPEGLDVELPNAEEQAEESASVF